MSCFRPLRAFRGADGALVFDSKRGQGGRPLDIPCGQCVGCRVARAQEWSLRCVHEASLHARNCFVTLTYRPEDLPADGSLNKAHWQLFAKRLRKRVGRFRYLHCGEYGDRSYRPHYHALLFGLDFMDDAVLWKEQGGNRTYTSKRLEATWKLGFCTVSALTRETAEYVARYTLKKVSKRVALERYRRIDLETGEEYHVTPEYATMSRRPGIGSGWFDKWSDDVFPRDNVVYRGRKYPVPRYYLNRLSVADPPLNASVKAKRETRMLELRRQAAIEALQGAGGAGLRSFLSEPAGGERSGFLPPSKRGNFSPERLAVREKVSEARLGRKRDAI